MVLQKQNKILNEFIGQQQVQGLDYAYTLEGWPHCWRKRPLVPGLKRGNDVYVKIEK